MTTGNEPKGASSTNQETGQQPPASKPLPQNHTGKWEDGKTYFEGREVVPVSDLIAAKKSLEKQIEDTKLAHQTEVDRVRTEHSNSLQSIATLNAKIKELEATASKTGVDSAELTKLKQEKEAAVADRDKANTKSLEHRRQLISVRFGLNPDQIKDKDDKALDAFEEALTAIGKGKGLGNYAVGGTLGSTAPKSRLDRAREVIAATPYAGARTDPSK